MAPDIPPTRNRAWYTLAAEDAAARLGTDLRHGLSGPEAARLKRLGPNALREAARRSPLRILLAQFTDFMILLLVAAAIMSGAVGDTEDAAAVLGIVVPNAAVGFVQEFRAVRAMAALTAVVVRGGRPHSVPAATPVPDDVVLLSLDDLCGKTPVVLFVAVMAAITPGSRAATEQRKAATGR